MNSYHELLECSTGRAEYLQSPKAEGSAVCDPSAWLHVLCLPSVACQSLVAANPVLPPTGSSPRGVGPQAWEKKERDRERVPPTVHVSCKFEETRLRQLISNLCRIGGNRTLFTPRRKPHNKWGAHVAGGLRTPPMPSRRRERARVREKARRPEYHGRSPQPDGGTLECSPSEKVGGAMPRPSSSRMLLPSPLNP